MSQQANGRAVLQANMTLKDQGTNDNNILQNIYKISGSGIEAKQRTIGTGCFKPY